jgi:hypothetical protein
MNIEIERTTALNTLALQLSAVAKIKTLEADLNKLTVRNSQLEAALTNTFPTVLRLAIAEPDRKSKDAVLHAMQIIPIPVAATYLGVPEEDLYRFSRRTAMEFGGRYCGAWCYSINELNLFAKNPTWFPCFDGTTSRRYFFRPEILLSTGTFVNAEIAMAYTNKTAEDLAAKVYAYPRTRRPYRLFDVQSQVRFTNSSFEAA